VQVTGVMGAEVVPDDRGRLVAELVAQASSTRMNAAVS
jgi:hypothetical protein